MKRTTISILALALAGILPIACWSTSSGAVNAPLKTGSVVGTFRLIGGPGPGESIPARGTVIFTQVAKGEATYMSVAVSATGRFIAHIPTGTWKVTASSPQFNSNQRGACGAVRPITVKVDKSTHVAVLCEMK
jgi:hypothetical protein